MAEADGSLSSPVDTVSQQLSDAKLTSADDDAEDGGVAASSSSSAPLSKGQKKKAKQKARKAEAQKEGTTVKDEEKAGPAATSAAAPPSAAPAHEQSSGNGNGYQTEEKQGAEQEDDEDEDEEEAAAAPADGEAAKKKKKKKRNRKKAASTPAASSSSSSSSAVSGADWSKAVMRLKLNRGPSVYNAANLQPVRTQTSPPSIPVSELFPSHMFPEGELLSYPLSSNAFRTTSEEKRAQDRLQAPLYEEIREAAEVHRQVRQDFMRWLRPGTSMIDIAQYIERATRRLIQADGLKRGWAFPTGLSLNHCAAHYSPNYKDVTVLKQSDVMKVDFGVHVNGRIIDCAFTVAFDERYDPLLNAVRDATNEGLRVSGIDVRLCDVGAAIQEVMEAAEVELDGKVHRVRSIKNLNGHSIGVYQIHGGKSVPIVRNQDTTRMEENEFYAIETFGSTGRGLVLEDGDCSHYMKVYDADTAASSQRLRTKSAKDLLRHIEKEHGTLAFCRRWLDDAGLSGYLLGLKQLCEAEVVRPYPPLVDVKGSYTAQFEHTMYMRPTCKEVISRGDDY